MLVFSAIVPHSPLLLPTIGKKHQAKLKKTLGALEVLKEEFLASRPDTLLVFSPHGSSTPDAFSFNIAPQYQANLQEFGDFTTKIEFKPNLLLIEHLKHLLKSRADLPSTANTEQFLDFGAAVPAHLLGKDLPSLKLLPINDAGLSLKTHYEFGQAIQDEIFKSEERIAVIASADLAHTLTDKAPGGFSPKGKEFDSGLVSCVKEHDKECLLNLESIAQEARACGLKTITMLFGVLDGVNCSPQPLSYEGPFGVGYLVAKIKLP